MTRLSQAIQWFFSILFGDGLKKLEAMKGAEDNSIQDEAPVQAVETGPSMEEVRHQGREEGACIFLGLLQEEARLLDFLMEDIGPFEDAQIGAAVRQVHGGASRFLREDFGLVPAREESEGATVQVTPAERARFQLVGNVPEKGSVQGVLRHHGWKVEGQVRLPNRTETDSRLITKAEIEVSS